MQYLVWNPMNFRALPKNVKMHGAHFGKVDYSIKAAEQQNLKFRRSIFCKRLTAGSLVSKEDVRIIRLWIWFGTCGDR